VQIRQVDLDRGDADTLDRVADRDRRMRVSAWIDHDRIGPTARELDQRDELAFEVRLRRAQLDSACLRETLELVLDLRERRRTVDLRRANAEEVQVRAVQHGDANRPRPARGVGTRRTLPQWCATLLRATHS
jgi:hypothetical protein